MCVCARVCVYAHRDGGVLHNCARLALCTRLHVHGSKGRGERKADARGVGGEGSGAEKGDTDKVSLRRSYYETKARKELEGGEKGEGNERRESYPYTVDIRLKFRFYTRLTYYMNDEIGTLGSISIPVSSRGGCV